jgi:hypothetical protein
MTYRSSLYRLAAGLSVLALVGACATRPVGPSVAVMPGPHKPFEVFTQDDAACRSWANQQSGGTEAARRANEDTVNGAIIGTLAGAALGAVASAGHGGTGAAGGAAIGAVAGTAIGAGESNRSVHQIQRDYDRAYMQCMYSRGNQVPGYAAPHAPPPAPAAPSNVPPPPPGSPPPPPPGVR